MKNWGLNLEGAPWWLFVLVTGGGLLLEAMEWQRAGWATMDPDACIQMCVPDGVLSASTTSCECAHTYRAPEAAWSRVHAEECVDLCGPGRTASYSSTGCVCGGVP